MRKITALHTQQSQASEAGDKFINASCVDDSVAVWCGTPNSSLSQLRGILSKFAPEKLAQFLIFQLFNIVVVESGLTPLLHAVNLHYYTCAEYSKNVMKCTTPAKNMPAFQTVPISLSLLTTWTFERTHLENMYFCISMIYTVS